MRRIGATLLALLLTMGAGCGSGGNHVSSASSSTSQGRATTISRSTFKGDWPFTVDSGELRCERPQSVIFTANGTAYGVNGSAMDHGHPSITPIWRKDPTGVTPRVNVGDVIDQGLQLCGSNTTPSPRAQNDQAIRQAAQGADSQAQAGAPAIRETLRTKLNLNADEFFNLNHQPQEGAQGDCYVKLGADAVNFQDQTQNILHSPKGRDIVFVQSDTATPLVKCLQAVRSALGW